MVTITLRKMFHIAIGLQDWTTNGRRISGKWRRECVAVRLRETVGGKEDQDSTSLRIILDEAKNFHDQIQIGVIFAISAQRRIGAITRWP